MELRHLRYFLVVAEEGQFTRAASRLAMQQPPLSQQIRLLEEEIGFELFERLPRGVVLTPAGKAFAQDAQRIIDGLQQSVERAARIARGELGTILIGLTSSASFHPLTTEAIREFRRLHPDVGIDLVELNAAEINERLAGGLVHVAFLRKPVELPPGLSFEVLEEEPMVVALPEDHPTLAGKQGRQADIALRALADEPFILVRRPGAPGMYADILTVCREAGFSPNVVREVPRMLSGIKLVSTGIGIALVPASMQRYNQAGVVYRRLKKPHVLTAPLTLSFPTTQQNGAASRFVEFVLGQFRQRPK
ncbi:LysR family transcriptional regulator [Trinickia dinghuensis]|uniref:LysR family transcriptional regulator n=1 Tax=Trinickia dinghuensis TaxID=2291023 RepID=A0A3D8JQS2_9BURK|nr:LysR family transcriptional regulator [Trinickia dinghuensis]RDU95473.1 LysR family transcriptional regulator [Trinickia dinghuensis]